MKITLKKVVFDKDDVRCIRNFIEGFELSAPDLLEAIAAFEGNPCLETQEVVKAECGMLTLRLSEASDPHGVISDQASLFELAKKNILKYFRKQILSE